MITHQVIQLLMVPRRAPFLFYFIFFFISWKRNKNERQSFQYKNAINWSIALLTVQFIQRSCNEASHPLILSWIINVKQKYSIKKDIWLKDGRYMDSELAPCSAYFAKFMLTKEHVLCFMLDVGYFPCKDG